MSLHQEFIYTAAPYPSCHASTIAETKNGTLIAAWFGGSRESAPDVAIWSAQRVNNKWTSPVMVAVADKVPCWNPVLHQMEAGPLLLFYRAGLNPETWSSFLMRSADGGHSWSQPEMLPAGVLGPIKNKPFELADGTLVCGSSVESYQAWACWVDRTADMGKTWSKHGPINLPDHLYGMIQPAIFGTPDGNLAMLCRTRGIGHMARATSGDGGQTWSHASPIDLPQNNSGLDAVLLNDGRVVVVYNHSTDARTPLNLAISHNLGGSWQPGPVLEQEPGEYSYPAIIQAKDGTIHITYTWNRQRIRYVTLQPDDFPA